MRCSHFCAKRSAIRLHRIIMAAVRMRLSKMPAEMLRRSSAHAQPKSFLPAARPKQITSHCAVSPTLREHADNISSSRQSSIRPCSNPRSGFAPTVGTLALLRLQQGIPELALNGHLSKRLPNTLYVSFPRVTGREWLCAVKDDVAASVGSACHSESDSVSGVLAAMNLCPARAMGAVRFSVGRYSTLDELIHASEVLIAAWKRLTASSKPLLRIRVSGLKAY